MRNLKSNHQHPIVCLDPGHYGTYNHSPVVPAYTEAQMVWKLHLLLKAELEDYGIEVRQTRSEQGRDMELTARGRASNGCDLFISLHSNACGTESVDRTEGIHFISRDGTDVDDRSKEIASMLAQTVYEVMDNHQRPKVYSKLASSDRNHDGVKNDNYYGVLHGAWMVGTPGLILEHSYHTNERAARWLLDEKNLQKLALAEAKTIAEWFDVSDNADSSAPGWKQNATGYWYVRPDGTYPISEFAYIDSSWYYFDSNGYMVTGWQFINDKWYYFCGSGAMMLDTVIDGYHLDASGAWVPELDEKPDPEPEVKVDVATGYNRAIGGKYKIVSDTGFLRLRSGASTDKPIIESMPAGGIVNCYGYHIGDWYYVVSPSGTIGYCHKDYLQKK